MTQIHFLSTVELTRAEEEHMPFVYSSWIRSGANGAEGRRMGRDAYCAAQHRIIEKLHNNGSIWIARGREDRDYLAGYIAYDVLKSGLFIHGAYVKRSCRGEGLLTMMLLTALLDAHEDAPRFYTGRRTRAWDETMARRGFVHLKGFGACD